LVALALPARRLGNAQRLDMGGIFDLGAGVVAARMTGDQGGSVEDADLFGVGEQGQLATHVGVRHGVVVLVEPGVGRLAYADRRGGRQRERVVRQRRKARRFEGERFAHAHRLAGTGPIGGRPLTPGHGLGVEIVDVGERASGEEVVADVSDGPLHPALFVASGDAHGGGSNR
jgi:hypothetical protein